MSVNERKIEHGGDWAGFLDRCGRMPLDFSASVSPLGLPAGVREAVIRSLDTSDRYPDPGCRALRRAIAAEYALPETQVVCGNGAADLIDRICRALHPKRALLPVPTFQEYERALQSVGCAVEHVPLRAEQDFAPEMQLLTAKLREDTDLVFFCNPNNPTGRLAGRDELKSLLSACRRAGARLVVDECFLDFTEEPNRHTLLGELSAWPELILLRAFTKTHAMAGLRLGYALCGNSAVAEALSNVGQPWPVSAPAQAAGIAALHERDYLSGLRALITRERERLLRELSDLRLRVIPGEANFLLFYCGKSDLDMTLSQRGILIRSCAAFPGLGDGWYRIAIRTEEENSALLRALREVL